VTGVPASPYHLLSHLLMHYSWVLRESLYYQLLKSNSSTINSKGEKYLAVVVEIHLHNEECSYLFISRKWLYFFNPHYSLGKNEQLPLSHLTAAFP
jgi:hypothetical protein